LRPRNEPGTAHAPLAILAWNAVTAQINAQGQVENVCVGTGMGFDPAFYYARPVSSLAPHGPGPVLLAKSGKAIINDEAMMFGRPPGGRHAPRACSVR